MVARLRLRVEGAYRTPKSDNEGEIDGTAPFPRRIITRQDIRERIPGPVSHNCDCDHPRCTFASREGGLAEGICRGGCDTGDDP